MCYKNKIICYFDILGFSKKVKNKDLDCETIEKIFREIREIINRYANSYTKISHFSDSILITTKLLDAFNQLRFVIAVQLKLLEYKLFSRGVISYGEIWHEENAFGPALVRAVELEKCKEKGIGAIFPRVIIDKELKNIIFQTIGNRDISYIEALNKFFKVKEDFDGAYYVDFISDILKSEKKDLLFLNLKQLISKGLEDEKIAEKYRWLNEKYSRVLVQ